jgi:superfamily II DNA or RNA helicase
MNIIITEQQYIKLIEDTQLSLFDDTVEDVCGQDIDYENFGFDKYYQRSYINLTDSTSDERDELYLRIKLSNCDIVLNNVITGEKFILSPDDINMTKTEHKKLYLPKNYGLQKFGKPGKVTLSDGENAPRLEFNGSIRPEQQESVQCYLEAVNDPVRMGGIISLPCGYGKCLAKDTPVLLYDGTIKPVQDIKPGDTLMGDDSKPRYVYSICNGIEKMYDIIPDIGDVYTVNESHILSLRNLETNAIEDIPVKEFLRWTYTQQIKYVVYRACIQFSLRSYFEDPYTYRKNIFNYHIIPDCYKLNAYHTRKDFLNGVLSEYAISYNDHYLIPIFEKPFLKTDLLFLIRSLGYPACADDNCIYMIKDVQFPIGLIIQYAGINNYYGFTINQNRRFVLGDFTVTHNTVISLYIASLIKKKTLVICHKDFLGNQWRERIEFFLPTAKIGLIKQNTVDINDKDIVIGSLQSIAMKDYDPSVFESFGLVICDECHHLSAEVFSQCLPKITNKRTLGLSATLNRKDGLTKVFEWFLGKPVFKIKREDNDLIVLVKRFYDPHEDYGRELKMWNGKLNVAKMINKICEFPPRNYMIVQTLLDILNKEPERQVLILSERRNHLTELETILKLNNIQSIGYYIGGMKQEDLDASAKKKIVLGTFQLASEGMDIPTLNTLVLASPVSSIEQAIGRIQRQKKADRKYTPLVIDIWDEFSLFDGQGRKRNTFYKKNKYTIQDTQSIQQQTLDTQFKYTFIKDPDEC